MAVKNKKFLKYIILALACILVIAITFIFTGGKSKKSNIIERPPVEICKASEQTVNESFTISGYIEAKAMIPVVPFVQGTIVSYTAKAGDFVKKDDILAQIDDAPYKQQFLQAEAAYWGYQNTFKRIESLYKSGSTSQQNYDSVKAQRDAAKAQYDLAKLQMDYTKVKAPVDGTILIADSAKGNIASNTQPLFVMADLNSLVIKLKVPEKYFDLFTLKKDQMKVSVTRPGQKGMYEDAVSACEIENIAPYVSPESKNFQVVCRVLEAGERFRPGMYVKVKAAYSSHENVMAIPLKALKLDSSFYTYDKNTQTVSFHEGTNLIKDENFFIAPEEFKNSYFIIDGQNSIFDGQKVKVVKGLEEEITDSTENANIEKSEE